MEALMSFMQALGTRLPVPPELQAWVLGLAFILGLCIGSFLNVVGLRFLADEPVTLPPSHCPHCKTPLRPYDNIPVLSFLLLGGACRDCKAPISIQYPLIELTTGVLFAMAAWAFGVSLQTLFIWFLLSNLVVIFITDLRERLIFQINSLSLVPAGLLYNLLNLGHVPGSTPLDLGVIVFHVPDAFISALLAVVIAIVFFEGMILLSTLAFGTEGFGHGDTHLMMGAGAFLGWPFLVLALLLGFVVQTIPAVPMLVIQWIRNKQWMSLGSGVFATLCGMAPLAVMNAPWPLTARTLVSLVFMVLSLVGLIVFLRQVKTSQSFTYLPLGPALVIGILAVLFWGNPMIAAYQQAMLASH